MKLEIEIPDGLYERIMKLLKPFDYDSVDDVIDYQLREWCEMREYHLDCTNQEG